MHVRSGGELFPGCGLMDVLLEENVCPRIRKQETVFGE
jgi:hypothetical protein